MTPDLNSLTIRTNIRDWRKASVFIVEVGPHGKTLRADVRAIAEDELTARHIIEALEHNLPASSRLYTESYDATTGITTLETAADHATLVYKLEIAAEAE